MSNPTKTAVIKAFLEKYTHADLSALYNHDMECQVNVAQDNGTRVEGEWKGRQWHAWTDGMTQWKSFRIPFNAHSEPTYEDKPIAFDLAAHAEGIGMTGWDWKAKKSRWVAFDFDAIVGHSDKHVTKLSQAALDEVRTIAQGIPWVTVRYSTGGKGLHLYVMLPEITTNNHTEHSALARSILGVMSGMTNFDFKSKVDICGGNMWVWHRKMKDTKGLQIIKQGHTLPLHEIPANWRDHIDVVSGKIKKTRPSFVKEGESTDNFERLSGQRPHIPLDEGHNKLLDYLKSNNAFHWWDNDHHMLVCHTVDLKEAHKHLQLVGVFETSSEGRNKGSDHNCFCYPLKQGAWSVRRYTRGCQEHPTWEQDGVGWTRCYYNREPDLGAACRSYGGIEHQAGGYIFQKAEHAVKAAQALGVEINLNPAYNSRQVKMKAHKDGRMIFELDHQNGDNSETLPGFLHDKSKWVRMYNTRKPISAEADVPDFDDLVRHIVDPSLVSRGWVVRVGTAWHEEPINHVNSVLRSQGQKPEAANIILGNAVMRPWKLVDFPFEPEYPGGRQWNREAAQFAFTPTPEGQPVDYPHWLKILNHVGQSLNEAVKANEWCQSNAILTGADYLKCWVASVFQNPFEPTPYLFFFGPQASGKSIFHEALSMLVTSGYEQCDHALQRDFNGELKNAIICVVEETDLQKSKTAYNSIKNWVTAKEISLHKKNQTPYMILNKTHWIQCANEIRYCPLFPGDTRITVSYVPELDEPIPKRQLLESLKKEAPDFLRAVLSIELPPPSDRLSIPVLENQDKHRAVEINQTALETFLEEKCFYVPGEVITLDDFFTTFQAFLDPSERFRWEKRAVSKAMPQCYPKGRYKTSTFHFGNISFTAPVPGAAEKLKLVAVGDKLKHVE